ncbi:MAG: type IV pilus modification protein PilV [Sulfuriferula sp.]|nr:type IV pilus modification protein PilV [Sulfuriferula sp.]
MNIKHQRKSAVNIHSQSGMVLIEAMIAVLIFSIGILGIVALQAAMIKSTSQAQYRAQAQYIAQQMLGNMWADPTNIANHYDYACTELPNGVCTAAAATSGIPGQVVITIAWQPPGDVAHNYVMLATVAGAA